MRVCSGAGCLRAVRDDVRFCGKPSAKTEDGIRTHSNAYDDQLDALRKSLRWQRLRARVIREQPMCARCDRHISEIGDHIVPAREAVAQVRASGRYPGDPHYGYFLRSNVQGLCRKCHYDKMLEDKTHTGPWPFVLAVVVQTPNRWSF